MMNLPAGADSSAAARQAMVASQLRTSGVNDPRVVDAMAQVPREAFLPESARAVAYRDRALPLGAGRALNPPLATGLLLTEARLRPEDSVLLIGGAGGYAAAVLAQLVARVVVVEADAALAALAREALAGNGKVMLVEGPLGHGAPDAAPFDVLMIDGAVEQVPRALAEQVRIGGRIVSGIVDRGVTRLAAGVRTAGGHGLVDFADSESAILPGFAPPPRFVF